MKTTDAFALRIYLNEAQKWDRRPLYEVIVKMAREKGMSGATVLRGSLGFGRSTEMHTSKILDLSVNLPILVELVDSKAKITELLPLLEEMLGGALVILEPVQVVQFGDAPAS